MDLFTLELNCLNLTLNIHTLIIIAIILILIFFFTPVRNVFHRFNFLRKTMLKYREGILELAIIL